MRQAYCRGIPNPVAWNSICVRCQIALVYSASVSAFVKHEDGDGVIKMPIVDGRRQDVRVDIAITLP